MSAAPSLVSDSPYLPGGWIGTPAGVKRKRSHREASPSFTKQISAKGKEKEENGAPWGVTEWKKLEKVYRSEREAWLKEREIKPLPTGGLLGWARRASSVGSAPRVNAWDGDRVVNRFLKEEGKEAKGDWDRSVFWLSRPPHITDNQIFVVTSSQCPDKTRRSKTCNRVVHRRRSLPEATSTDHHYNHRKTFCQREAARGNHGNCPTLDNSQDVRLCLFVLHRQESACTDVPTAVCRRHQRSERCTD